jgi:hypothetical protein
MGIKDMTVELTNEEYIHLMALLEKENDAASEDIADKLFVCYHNTLKVIES